MMPGKHQEAVRGPVDLNGIFAKSILLNCSCRDNRVIKLKKVF